MFSFASGSCHPQSGVDVLSPDEVCAQNNRIDAHRDFYQLLSKTCFYNPERFIHGIPSELSPRRQDLQTDESLIFWQDLRAAGVNSSPNPAHEIQLKIMEKMFHLIWKDAFKDLPTVGNVTSYGDMIVAQRALVRKLIDFFAIFEFNPYGKDHGQFRRALYQLVAAAYQLRTLLTATERFHFSVQLPLHKPNDSRKLEYLRNRVEIVETHGATHRVDDSSDVVRIVLCGGILRWTSPRGAHVPAHNATVECRAVAVAWRPDEDEQLSPWVSGLTEEELQSNARAEAEKLALDLFGP